MLHVQEQRKNLLYVMGRKSKDNNSEITIEHIQTTLFIKKVRLCSKCPLKLYAKDDDKIILGTGNIFTDTIMILPSYDVKAGIGYPTILKLLQDNYKNITGLELLENCYVTRGVKCLNKTDFDLNTEAIKSCITNIYYEINKIKPKKIIIFDKLIYNFGLYRCNAGKWIIKTVMSPAVLYYDNENLKDKFIKQLNEAINDMQL